MIKIYDQTLASDFCQKIIDTFEKYPDKHKHGPNVCDFKYDLFNHQDWLEIDIMLNACMNHFLSNYLTKYPELSTGSYENSGYHISRYSPIYDGNEICGLSGNISLIWFLNIVDIGSLVFEQNSELIDITPQIGRLVIFPRDITTFKYISAGNSSKYLVTNSILPKS